MSSSPYGMNAAFPDSAAGGKPSVVVFGSEANGLSADELDLIGEKMLIPMENNVESLNLAVSNGIVLFEALRQNRLT